VPGQALADTPGTLLVSGRGEVSAQPDRAALNLFAEARRPELAQAREEVNGSVRDMLRLLRSLGIEERHVDTTGLSVQPEYDWNPQTRERVFLGYRVSRRIDVDLRDLERLGAVMEGAVDRGITRISEPRLLHSDPTGLRRQALALAAEDARRNAEVLATSLGAQVGTVRRIVASDTPGAPEPRVMMARSEAVADTAGAESYSAGELQVSAWVEVEFGLLPD
jgi:uncharacterized protein YggE